MSNGRFTPNQRAAVFLRADGHCEICGCTLRELGWNLHHRVGRGMGGTRRRPPVSEGMALCGSGTTGCHGQVTDPSAFGLDAKWAEDRGFVVRRSDHRDCAEIPVLIQGQWLLLDEAGGYQLVDDYRGLPELVKGWGE